MYVYKLKTKSVSTSPNLKYLVVTKNSKFVESIGRFEVLPNKDFIVYLDFSKYLFWLKSGIILEAKLKKLLANFL